MDGIICIKRQESPFLIGEPLQDICRFLSAYDIGLLWFTGSKRLRAQLSQHVMVFTLQYPSKGHSNWPRLLSSFPHLVDVYIGRSDPKKRISLKKVDLSTISPTVKRLNLDFENGFLSLLLPPPNLSEGYVNAANMIDIKRLFPNLQELKWKNAYNMPWVPISNQIDILAGLSLTEVVLPIQCMYRLHTKLSLLPDTVTSLSCSIKIAPEDIPQSDVLSLALPHNLSKLSLKFLVEPDYTFPGLSQLPQTIRKLKLSVDTRVNQLRGVWPPQLTSLTFTSFMQSWTPENSEDVPRTVTSLSLTVFRIQAGCTALFPPGLVKLKATRVGGYIKGYDLSREDIAALPPNLRILSFGYLKRSISYIDVLPRRLEKLKRFKKVVDEGRKYLELDSVAEWLQLPPNISSVLGNEMPTDGIPSDNKIRHLSFSKYEENNDLLYRFHHLESLSLVIFDKKIPALNTIRTQIKSLDISRIDISKLDFSVPCLSQLEELGISPTPTSPHAVDSILEDLPRTLKTLRVTGPIISILTPANLVLLPPKLTSLRIELKDVSRDIMEALPRCLLQLRLSVKSTVGSYFLSDLTVLPPLLQGLFLPSACDCEKKTFVTLYGEYASKLPALEFFVVSFNMSFFPIPCNPTRSGGMSPLNYAISMHFGSIAKPTETIS